MLCLSEKSRFLQSSSFWEACALIGQLSGVLWLAEIGRFHNETHSVYMTWRQQQQYYSENKSYAFFHCVYVWAVLCKSSHTVT